MEKAYELNYNDIQTNEENQNNGKDPQEQENPKFEERVGTTLDEELKKVKGNNLFYVVMSSLVIAFAWAEIMVFSIPFLELIPPLE